MGRIRKTSGVTKWAVVDDDASGDTNYLYCIVEKGTQATGPCKVGVAQDVYKRLCSLQGGNWRALEVSWTLRLNSRYHALSTESLCLIHFRPDIFGRASKKVRLSSEWVAAKPEAVLDLVLSVLRRAGYVITGGDIGL